jgi:D-serine deaminase-like pyridoxal phosphate-dependent protein
MQPSSRVVLTVFLREMGAEAVVTSRAVSGLADRSVPPQLELLDTPSVVVEVGALHRNLEQMADLSRDRDTVLRPHVKSHKSRALMRAQLDSGASGITVAKLDEVAGMSGADGCRDVFLAYPITAEHKAVRAMGLAQELDLTLTIDTVVGAELLDRTARDAGLRARVLIEVDSGLARCGLPARDVEDFVRQVRRFGHLDIAGVFSHAGHAYAATSPAQLREIAEHEVRTVSQAAAGAVRGGADVRVRSVGSTPTVLTNVDGLREMSEIRPGNYVFKDRMQVSLDVASISECALSVVTTVVSTASGNAVIDAGSKTLGLDKGAHGNDSLVGYGVDVETGIVVDRLSEEHGIITGGAAQLRPGDRLRLVPNHACVVTDLTSRLYAVDGDDVIGTYDIDVRGGGY